MNDLSKYEATLIQHKWNFSDIQNDEEYIKEKNIRNQLIRDSTLSREHRILFLKYLNENIKSK